MLQTSRGRGYINRVCLWETKREVLRYLQFNSKSIQIV